MAEIKFLIKSIKLKPQTMIIGGKSRTSAKQMDEWKFKSCEAECGVGNNWATLYYIRSKEKGKGHATALLLIMKKYNDRMQRLYQKCGIEEYTIL